MIPLAPGEEHRRHQRSSAPDLPFTIECPVCSARQTVTADGLPRNEGGG